MGFFKWLTEPLAEILYEFKPQNYEIIEENSPVEFTRNPDEVPIFRPQTFSAYIGQERAKQYLKSNIEAIKQRKLIMPHVILSGPAGYGKTTLAKIIANELQVEFKEHITSSLESPWNLLYAIKQAQKGVIFLDEIHAIPRSMAESIYPIMEDFKYSGEPIEHFTLIGATTEIGEMYKDRRPFIDRFKIIIELEDYSINDLVILVKQYHQKTFPLDKLTDDAYQAIASNCRETPRNAIRLLESCIFMNGNVRKTLYYFNIIKDGYTEKDLKILGYVALNDKGVGLQGLASFLGTSAENYTYTMEPYLLKNQLITRTPRGRRITDLGKQKINELTEANKIIKEIK